MREDGRFLEGYYSLLDAERRFSFVSRPDGHELLEPIREEGPVARVMWFSGASSRAGSSRAGRS